MRLSWRRSSNEEDRFEQWIAQQHERRVLAGETTPIGPCPDDAFLRDLARRSPKIVLSDSRVDHAATCPTCMNRLLALRQEQRSSGRNVMIAAAVAACVIIAVAFVVGREVKKRASSASNTMALSQTVNLWDAETIRGLQPGQLQSVTLPAALIKLTVVLPRHSAPGQYLVAVTRDQNGNGALAEGLASTVTNGSQERVTANLDLRNASAGQYFLSTTHEKDQAAYYYPLRIR